MQTHHHPEAIPVHSFHLAIEEAVIELQKSQHFLQRVESEPLLLFKEGSIYLKSSRNIVTSILGTSYSKTEPVTTFAFQVYMATILDRAFKAWSKEQDWEHDVSVLVRQPLSFPSIFALYVDEREVIQFNIFERWYGIRGKTYTEEEFIEHYRKSEENTLTDIEKTKKEIDYWKQVKGNPWTFIKNFKDVRMLLFERNTINENIEKKITAFEADISAMRRNLRSQQEGIPQLLEQQEARLEITEKMSVFFKELEYSLMEERSKLY